jgi:hypothetical protein
MEEVHVIFVTQIHISFALTRIHSPNLKGIHYMALFNLFCMDQQYWHMASCVLGQNGVG